MPLHLVKLCVGVDAVEELDAWVAERLQAMRRAGETPEQHHTTRMIPKRRDEILQGGSLYWVIRGHVQVRQRLLDIRPFRDADGIRRCRLVLEPVLVPTEWQPRRAFQGWRYLAPKDAPADLSPDSASLSALPAHLRKELAELGLL